MGDQSESFRSRRDVVSGLGVGIATLVASSAARAQQGVPQAPAAPAGSLQDPTTRFPKPPFAGQSQPWPGLASKMNPRPDHGETSYRGSGRLAGRKALITGGDSGMGRAAAIAYAREGADVAINYLPAEESDAREVIALIEAERRRGVPIPGDLRDEAFCQPPGGRGRSPARRPRHHREQRRAAADPRVDPGHHDGAIRLDHEDERLRAVLDYQGGAAASSPGVVIIGTTSEQAYDPSPDLYDYAQTKAATANYVKSLAKQLGPKGIRVNGVAPGPIWTPLQVSGGATQEKLKNFGASTPLGRPGQPAELAGIYVQLAANDASYANGQIYGASGGAGQP